MICLFFCLLWAWTVTFSILTFIYYEPHQYQQIKIIKINQPRVQLKKIKNPLNKMERESMSCLCREGKEKKEERRKKTKIGLVDQRETREDKKGL